jgi:signal transduction histidine kinase
MSDSQPDSDSSPIISVPRLANFVRQVTHDVRNGLNAIDLQAAFIAEIATDAEVSAEMAKLRRIVGHMTEEMQRLSQRFGELRPMIVSFPIEEFLQGVKIAAEEEFEKQAKRIIWEIKGGEVEMEMDYNLLLNLVIELIRNAIYFREGDHPIHFMAAIENGSAIFETRQIKSKIAGEPEAWGNTPLETGRRGGYGLGLYHTRRVLETLKGRLDPHYDAASSELRVRATLPLKQEKEPGTQSI